MPAAQRHKLWDTLLVILLIGAASEFVLRGPVRFAQAGSFNDFISPYVQTRLWLAGQDPYSARNLVSHWPPEAELFEFLPHDLSDGSLVYKRGIPTAYPPSSFVLLSPFAVLPWRIAHPLWLLITVAAFCVAVASLLAVANLLPWNRRSFAFLAVALALAPFHTGLAAGSIVCVAVAAVAGAVWAASRGRDLLAGVLLAAAVGLKPQIGLPFLLYYCIRQRWRTVAVAAGTVASLFVLALLRIAAAQSPWLDNYVFDNRVLLGPGSLGDFTEANPLHLGLINFQLAAYAFVHNREAANVTALTVAAAAGLVWLFFVNKQTSRSGDLLALSAVATLSLLPVYHRAYDATLLIFPVAWAFAALEGRTRNIAMAVLALSFVFFVPGGTILQELQRMGYFAALRNAWWWNGFVLPHECWAVLLLGLLLLRAMQQSLAGEGANRSQSHLS